MQNVNCTLYFCLKYFRLVFVKHTAAASTTRYIGFSPAPLQHVQWCLFAFDSKKRRRCAVQLWMRNVWQEIRSLVSWSDTVQFVNMPNFVSCLDHDHWVKNDWKEKYLSRAYAVFTLIFARAYQYSKCFVLNFTDITCSMQYFAYAVFMCFYVRVY